MFPFDASCLQLRRWRGTWLSWPVKWLHVTSAACTASGGRWASLYLQNHPSPSLTSPLVNTSLSIVFVCLFIYLSAIWALKSKLNIINSEFQSELGTSNFPFLNVFSAGDGWTDGDLVQLSRCCSGPSCIIKFHPLVLQLNNLSFVWKVLFLWDICMHFNE